MITQVHHPFPLWLDWGFSFHFISFHKKIIMIDIDIRYPIFV